jgi:hypothetical protein
MPPKIPIGPPTATAAGIRRQIERSDATHLQPVTDTGVQLKVAGSVGAVAAALVLDRDRIRSNAAVNTARQRIEQNPVSIGIDVRIENRQRPAAHEPE